MDRIYVQTNDAERNELVAFDRAADGKLTAIGHFDTGGRGSGTPHLASQSSVVVSGDRVLVTNAGSDELSLFRVTADGLELAAPRPERRQPPDERRGSRRARLRAEQRLARDRRLLARLARAARGHAADAGGGRRPGADRLQPGRPHAGRDRARHEQHQHLRVNEHGLAEGPQTIASSGATPYGFDFAGGSLVVTEAFGGEAGAAAASSYSLGGERLEPVSGSVANTRSEVCWAAVTHDGRFVYVTNFGDGTISSYRIGDDGSLELLEPVAASTNMGQKGLRDEAITGDGRFLYALDADARRIYGWSVGEDGSLAPVGDADGLPETVAGLAAS